MSELAIEMLRRFKAIKRNLIELVVSEEWSSCKGDGPGRAQFVKQKILDDEGEKT